MIVTSVSPTSIASCIRFDCEDGSQQLMCMLQGKTSSFKISTATEFTPRIRFIDSAFKSHVSLICVQEQEKRMPLLCQLLVDEVTSGRVIVETKRRDGKVVAIISPQLIDHAKTKKYGDNVEVAGNKFFKEIADAFDTNLQTILSQIIAFNKEQNKPETQLEAAKKQLDRQIIVQKLPKATLSGFIAAVVKSLSDLFKSTTSKAQAKFIEEAREQARLSCQKQRQDRRKERRKRTEERKNEDKKLEIIKSEIRADAIRQEITV
ncbi:MAG: hypothetical protein JSR37_08080 [Verrucomicrobia bacterium]|nr:hypothetical protein [Verrucomicrobiota bacterium]